MSNPSKELRLQQKIKMPRYSNRISKVPSKTAKRAGLFKIFKRREHGAKEKEVSKQLQMKSNTTGCGKTKGADGSRVATETAWKMTMQQTKVEWPNYMANNTNKTKITMLNKKWKEKKTAIKQM